MKKKVLIGASVIIVVLLCVVVAELMLSSKGNMFKKFSKSITSDNDNKSELSNSERIAKVLTTTHKTDLMVFGNEVDFESYVDYRKIDKIDGDTVENDTYEFKAIIVNDLNGNINLDEDEINYLHNFINSDNNVLIYLGEKYSNEWIEDVSGVADVKDNLWFEYYSVDSNPKRTVGLWTKYENEEFSDKPGMLADTVLEEIEDFINQNV